MELLLLFGNHYRRRDLPASRDLTGSASLILLFLLFQEAGFRVYGLAFLCMELYCKSLRMSRPKKMLSTI